MSLRDGDNEPRRRATPPPAVRAPAATPVIERAARHAASPSSSEFASVVEASPQPRSALDRALVQFRRTVRAAPAREDVPRIAAEGQRGSSGPLPHAERIQASFGRHDVSHVRTYSGPQADRAASELGARAYASGDAVVLGSGADLHTVAHEAAHVVQQRAGVSLDAGVGSAGDVYERHADAVADRVVAGQSAEGLLDRFAGGASASSPGGGRVQLLREISGAEARQVIDERMAAQDAEFINAMYEQMGSRPAPRPFEDVTFEFQASGESWHVELQGGDRYNHIQHQLERAVQTLRANPDAEPATAEGALRAAGQAPGRDGQAMNGPDRSGGGDGGFQVQRTLNFPKVKLMSIPNPSQYVDSFEIEFSSNLEVGDYYRSQGGTTGRQRREAADHMNDGANLQVAGTTGDSPGVEVTSNGTLLAAAQEHWHELQGCPVSDQLQMNTNGSGSIGIQLDLSEYVFPGLSFQFTAVDVSRDDGIRLGLAQGSQSLQTPVFTAHIGGREVPMRLNGQFTATLDPNWTAIAASIAPETTATGASLEAAGIASGAGTGTIAAAVAAPVIGAVVIVGGTMLAMLEATREGERRGLGLVYSRIYADRLAARVFGMDPQRHTPPRTAEERSAWVEGRNDGHDGADRLSAAQMAALRTRYHNYRALQTAVDRQVRQELDLP